MHMVCTNTCTNAMDACTCVFIMCLSCISLILLAHPVYVNACAPQYLKHSPNLKHTPTIYNQRTTEVHSIDNK